MLVLLLLVMWLQLVLVLVESLVLGLILLLLHIAGQNLVVRMGINIHTKLLDSVVILTGCYFLFEAAKIWLADTL